MAWADNLNILLNMQKLFSDKGQASKDRSLQYRKMAADSDAQRFGAMSEMGNTLLGTGQMFNQNMQNKLNREQEMAMLGKEQAFEKPYKDTTAEMQRAQQDLSERQYNEEPERTQELTDISMKAQKEIDRYQTELERAGYKTPKKTIFVPNYGELELQESVNEQTAAENIELIRNAYSMGERNLQLALGNDEDKLNASNNFLQRIEMLKQDISEKALQTKYFIKGPDGELAPNYSVVTRRPGETQDVVEQRWSQEVSQIPELMELARVGLDSAFQVLEQYDAVKLAPYDKATYMKVLLNAPPKATFAPPAGEVPAGKLEPATTAAGFFTLPVLGDLGQLFLSKESREAVNKVKEKEADLKALGVDKKELDFVEAIEYTVGLMNDWKKNLNVKEPSDLFKTRLLDIKAMYDEVKKTDTSPQQRAQWLETLKQYIGLYKDEAYANDPLYTGNY